LVPPRALLTLPLVRLGRPHLADGWPEHVVLGQVVPGHFVYACLKNILKVGVDRFVENAGDAKLVYIKDGRVAIVEDQGVAEVVVWRAVEHLLAWPGRVEDVSERVRGHTGPGRAARNLRQQHGSAGSRTLKAREEDLCDSPGVVEIVQDLPPRGVEVWEGQVRDRAILRHARAALLWTLARPVPARAVTVLIGDKGFVAPGQQPDSEARSVCHLKPSTQGLRKADPVLFLA
jgi:hypothetical protein